MKTLILLSAALLLIASPSQACLSYHPRPEAIKAAAIVFRGQVIEYRAGDDVSFASLYKFRVTEMIRGEAHDELVATWTTSRSTLPVTSTSPIKWQGQRDLIVALVPRSNVIDGIAYQILRSGTCSSPSLKKDTPLAVDEVRKLLAAP